MTESRTATARRLARAVPARRLRPEPEALESRTLLSSATIGQWTYSSRITFSFMPDGTSLGGVSSNLFQTLNAIAPTATWETQLEQAATVWETVANVNLAVVPDGGEALGASGDQQDDPRFGDIRIGAMPLGSGVLAETFLPPPSNGGTDAGDIILNSSVEWTIGGVGYDLQTVMAHEFGHALGLADESTDINAEMYYAYDGIKTAADITDIATIQSLYGAPAYDRFNQTLLHNSSPLTATNIMTYMNSSDQIALSGLDNTTGADTEYYAVTVPSGGSGHMTVTLQSSNLSVFAPLLNIYNSSLGLVASQTDPTTYGATLTETISVTAGQKYYIKVAATGLYGQVGTYGLEVNFGTQTMSPIAPPNTVVAAQANAGSTGTTTANAVVAGSNASVATPPVPGAEWVVMGDLSGWALTLDTPSSGAPQQGGDAPAPAPASSSTPVATGTLATSDPTSSATTTTASSGAGPATTTATSTTTTTTTTTSTNLVPQAVDDALSSLNAD